MAGINFDTANTGYGGNYGGGMMPYYGGSSNWTDLAALALVTGGFGFGGHRGGGYDYGKACCAPATCEQVNDCDRDVLKSAFETTEAVHDEGRRIEKDVWDVDRDVLLGDKCIEQKICESTHQLEKDIFCVDKDVLLGFKETDHRIDMLKCETKEGFAEVKGLIRQTTLEQDNQAQAKEICKLRDAINKKDTVAEILAALGKTPVIATV